MMNQINKQWLQKIEQARSKEKIINRWMSGENLSDIMKEAPVSLSRAQWWALKKKYKKNGFQALIDKRGGRIPKITEEIEEWIIEIREEDEDLNCDRLQQLLEEEFDVYVGQSTISKVLKEYGISRRPGRPKKEQLYDPRKGTPIDYVGVWFLKGADKDMKGIKTTVEIVEDEQKKYEGKDKIPWWRILRSERETIIRKTETLLYLPVFNMNKPYHLRRYHKRGLGILTGTGKKYSYHTMDGFLNDLEKLKIGSKMAEKLARCYLEALCIQVELKDGSYFYIDGHSKHVWSSKNIPKVFFTTLKRAERGVQQYFINSSKGHPLILLSCPGDSHLTKEMFNLIESFENAVGKEIMKVSIFDREGLSLAVFDEFARRKKYFITLLRSNQYRGEEDFEIVKDFSPFKKEKKNGEKKVTQWVAEGWIQLKDRATKKEMTVRTALVKKKVKGKKKLIAIITNLTRKEEPNIARVARRYFDRWPNQENIFKDMIGAIKYDSNHGYDKTPVENRVVLRKKEELEQNLRGVDKKIPAAQKKVNAITKEKEKMEKVYKSRKNELLSRRRELHSRIGFEGPEKRRDLLKELKSVDDKLLTLSEGYPKYIQQAEDKLRNKTKYLKSLMSRKEKKERELKELNLKEKLFEIDTEKDHIMSNFKILLTNLSSYAQEQYFPQEERYQNATLETMLKTFYRQDGYVKTCKTKVEVTLHSYDDPQLQKAAETACEKFNNSKLHTLSGQRIWMRVESQDVKF